MARALGMDPGLGSFGLALVDEGGTVLDLDALGTEPGDEVRATRAAKRSAKAAGKSGARRRKGQKNATVEQFEDRDRRLREVFTFVDEFVGDFSFDCVVAEAGRAMGDVGTDGIISLAAGSTVATATAWRYGVPVVWVTQLEWRRVIAPRPASGRLGDWTQQEIAEAIGLDVEERAKRVLKMRGRSITIRNHAMDAVGIARWGIRCSLAVMTALKIPGAPGVGGHEFEDVDGVDYCRRCGIWQGAATPICTPKAAA